MKILADYNLKELQELLNLPKFRVNQIFDAIMQAKAFCNGGKIKVGDLINE